MQNYDSSDDGEELVVAGCCSRESLMKLFINQNKSQSQAFERNERTMKESCRMMMMMKNSELKSSSPLSLFPFLFQEEVFQINLSFH